MPEPDKNSPPEKTVSEKRDERNAWVDEQKKHEYYYDDAHGYQAYDPDKPDDDEPESGQYDTSK